MTEYEVVLSNDAERDLDDIAAYVETAANAQVARTYIARIEAKIATLAFTPFRGTLREELGLGVRTFGFEKKATITIRIDRTARQVEVLGIFHGGRQVTGR